MARKIPAKVRASSEWEGSTVPATRVQTVSTATAVAVLGSDVEVAPKKTYVSLRRSKQFAIAKAATKTRFDLGLNLKGEEATERLEGGKVLSPQTAR